jgi:hypothetical protein
MVNASTGLLASPSALNSVLYFRKRSLAISPDGWSFFYDARPADQTIQLLLHGANQSERRERTLADLHLRMSIL